MNKAIIGYGFFKPDALEDGLIEKIVEFINDKGFCVKLLKKCEFTHNEVVDIYKYDWSDHNTQERKHQLYSNLRNLTRPFSYSFEVSSNNISHSNEKDLYSELDNLKGKAYDNPRITIRSYFRTPLEPDMSTDEETYRISRNRIHLPTNPDDIFNLKKVLKSKGII